MEDWDKSKSHIKRVFHRANIKGLGCSFALKDSNESESFLSAYDEFVQILKEQLSKKNTEQQKSKNNEIDLYAK